MKKKINVLMVAGFFSIEHGSGREVTEMLRTLLLETGQFDVKICEEFRGITDETLEDYDVIINLYEGKESLFDEARRFGEQTERTLFHFVSSGKGIVFYHAAACLDPTWPDEFRKMMGMYFMYDYSRRNPQSDFVVKRADHDSTGITKYMPEEWYTVEEDKMVGIAMEPDNEAVVLCTAFDALEDYDVPNFPPTNYKVFIPDDDITKMPGLNQDAPLAWATHYGDGRCVSITLGHGDGTIKRAGFMTLFVRSVEWAATGKATILPPNRDGDNRLFPWPYYDKEKNPAQCES